jgi:drug/metabolite transporter (DMT)-like permease
MLWVMVHGGVLAGMAAATAAACCFDGAIVLQASEARSADPELGLRLALLRRLAARPRWLLGAGLAVLGWPLLLLALSLAPVTLVQPTLAVGLVLLLVAGSRVLGEHVGAREWLGAAAVIAGVVALAFAGLRHTDAAPSAGRIAAAAIGLGSVTALPFVSRRARGSAWALIAGGGCAFALSALTSKLLTIELAHGRPLAALGWGLATAASSALGLLIDTTAMQRFEATRVSPPMFVLETALPVALAPLLFHERWSTAEGGPALVVAALVIVLLGGGLLGASRRVVAAGRPGGGSVPGERQHEIGGAGELGVGRVGPSG